MTDKPTACPVKPLALKSLPALPKKRPEVSSPYQVYWGRNLTGEPPGPVTPVAVLWLIPLVGAIVGDPFLETVNPDPVEVDRPSPKCATNLL